MNLIQTQERIKKIPLSQVVQYANGADPEMVPPFLALAEIQRRNEQEKNMQRQTPPDSSVKDKIEREAVESGIKQLATDQARQAQNAQQMQQQMTQPTPQVPEGAPTAEAPEEPPAFAEGGITSLPVGNMFNFNNGGVVAFADGDYVENPFKEEKKPAKKQAKPAPREGGVPNMLNEAYRMMQQSAPQTETYEAAMERAKQTNPDLQKPIGEDYLGKLKSIEQADIDARRKFEEREANAGRQAFWDSLIAAGEASRGGGGIGSLLGGFGRSYSGARQAADERRVRQEALQREQDLNMAKMNMEIQNLRRAEARGDVAAAQAHQLEIAKLNRQLETSKLALAGQLAQVQESAKGRGAMMSAYQPEVIKMAEYLRQKFPDMPEQQLLDTAVKYTRAGIAGDTRMDAGRQEIIRKIEDKYRSLETAYATNPAELAKIQQRKQEEINRVLGQQGGIAQPTPGIDPSQWGTPRAK